MSELLNIDTLKKQKVIAGNFKVKQWLEFFENVRIEDQKQDIKYYQRGYNTGFIIALILCIATIVLPILLDLIFEIGLLDNYIGFIILLAVFLGGLAWYFNAKIMHYMRNEDIGNYYAYYLLPMLYFLKHEIGEESKVYVKFDNTYWLDNKKARKERINHLYDSFNFYYDTMPIHLKFNMEGNIQIDLNLNIKANIASLKKINPRGKVKMKYKGVARAIEETRISIPKDKYIKNTVFEPYKSTETHLYFKFKEKGNTFKHKDTSLGAVEKAIFLDNAYMTLDKVIHQVHHLYQYIKK